MPQQPKDLYEILGVERDATQDEIKKAYRKLARQYHPDVNKDPGAEDKFKEINGAYEILGNEEKRKQYDRFGTTDGTAGGFDFSSIFGDQGDPFSDLFNMFTGGGTTYNQANYRSAPHRGEDQYQRMTIEFMEAIEGTTRTIRLDLDEPCDHCHGSGAETKEDLQTCPRCHGRGYVVEVTNSLFGQVQRQTVCPECGGTGQTIKNKCHECHGTGFHHVRKELEIKIPQGIQSGQRIRLAGKGGAGMNGGPNGDLYIEILVKEHPVFKREGQDIYIEVPISAVDATLGTSLKVPTVHGDVDLSIPGGTQPGQRFRLKGQGVPYGKANGDQYVDVKIEIPKKVSDKERELYEQLRDHSNRAEEDTPFERFKKFFSGK